MSGTTELRTPKQHAAGDPGTKRSVAIALGALGVSMVGGYGLMSGAMSNCKRPPQPESPEAVAMDPAELTKMREAYEHCRRRRSATSSSRSSSRPFFSSTGSSRSSVSRGGFGRSGSFGG